VRKCIKNCCCLGKSRRLNDIAGIVNKAGNVIGMMPHPENMIEPLHGKTDCRPLFESLLAA